jgi:hypothetical protein
VPLVAVLIPVWPRPRDVLKSATCGVEPLGGQSHVMPCDNYGFVLTSRFLILAAVRVFFILVLRQLEVSSCDRLLWAPPAESGPAGATPS